MPRLDFDDRELDNAIWVAGAALVSSLIGLGILELFGGVPSTESIAWAVVIFGTLAATGAILRALAHEVPERKGWDFMGKVLAVSATSGASANAGLSILAGF